MPSLAQLNYKMQLNKQEKKPMLSLPLLAFFFGFLVLASEAEPCYVDHTGLELAMYL